MYPLAVSQEAYDEQEAERTAPPTTMADEHREWHRIAGVPIGAGTCPWDACDGDQPHRRAVGAHRAKLSLLRRAGYYAPIPPREQRTPEQIELLVLTNATWQASIQVRRVRRGLTFGVNQAGRAVTVAEAEQRLTDAQDALDLAVIAGLPADQRPPL